VITVEDWAEIRRLHLSERMSIKAIAKKLHLARNTVRNAVRSAQPPRYVRAGTGSVVDGAEPRIRALLKETPDMPATVIAERIAEPRVMWRAGAVAAAGLRRRIGRVRPTTGDVASVIARRRRSRGSVG
jgi:DNA-binding transcriptional regulator LsrR (DeoR family)